MKPRLWRKQSYPHTFKGIKYSYFTLPIFVPTILYSKLVITYYFAFVINVQLPKIHDHVQSCMCYSTMIIILNRGSLLYGHFEG